VGVVLIRCPQTGHVIPTGIEADRQSFARAPVFFSRTFCPLCRTNHEWFAKDAWVRDVPRRGSRRPDAAAAPQLRAV
jgi:hypothetical protein